MSNAINMKYRKSSHVTFDCRYHLVRVTKYRNDVLDEKLIKRLDERLRELCKKMYVNIMSIWMEDDHVHMYISIPVSKSIPYVVQRLKWVTSKEIMKEYKNYLKRWYWSEEATLRARWYFVCTVWEITSEVVKNYVDAQWKEEVLWVEVEL